MKLILMGIEMLAIITSSHLSNYMQLFVVHNNNITYYLLHIIFQFNNLIITNENV